MTVTEMKERIKKLEAEVEFKEEVTLYKVSDYLRSIGQPALANRIDPRVDDVLRNLGDRSLMALDDSLKKSERKATKKAKANDQ